MITILEIGDVVQTKDSKLEGYVKDLSFLSKGVVVTVVFKDSNYFNDFRDYYSSELELIEKKPLKPDLGLMLGDTVRTVKNIDKIPSGSTFTITKMFTMSHYLKNRKEYEPKIYVKGKVTFPGSNYGISKVIESSNVELVQSYKEHKFNSNQSYKDYYEKTSDEHTNPNTQKSYITTKVKIDEHPQRIWVKPMSINKLNSKEEGKMKSSLKKIFGGIEIGKDNSGLFKLSPFGGLAILNNENKYVVYDGESMVDVMDTVLDIDNVIYRIPVAKVKEKDLIIHHRKPLYVRKVNNDGTLSCISPSMDSYVTVVPQKNLFGFNFFVKVVTIFELGNQISGTSNTQANNMMSLLPMILLMKENNDLTSLLPFMMLSDSNMLPNGTQSNMMSLLPMLLLVSDDDNDLSSLLPFMMLSGGNLQTPFAGFNTGVHECSCEKQEGTE